MEMNAPASMPQATDGGRQFSEVIVDARKEEPTASSAPEPMMPAPYVSKLGPQLVLKVALASVIITAVFYVAMFIYLGAGSEEDKYTDKLEIAVMNFDNGKLGQAFLAFASSWHGGHGMPSFKVIPNATSVADIRDRVANAEYWGAVVVQENAMNKLMTAFATANTSYNPANAMLFFYDESRFYLTTASKVAGPGRAILTAFCQNFASSLLQSMSQSPVYAPSIAAVGVAAPTLLTKAVWFTEVKIRTMTAEITTWGFTVGMVLIAVFGFVAWEVSCELTEPAAAPATGGGFRRLFLVRMASVLWLTFFLALGFTAVWEALWGGFPSGRAWVGFWLLHWLHMFHYSTVFAAATHLMDMEKALRASALIIMLNATGNFYDLTLAHPFYQWGWAMPMTHAVIGSRTLLFNGRDQLGMNVGAIVAWTVVFFALALALAPRYKLLATEKGAVFRS